MRYGLLALSLAMLTGGGVAAQSALDISHSARITLAAEPRVEPGRSGGSYGALPFTAVRSQAMRLAAG